MRARYFRHDAAIEQGAIPSATVPIDVPLFRCFIKGTNFPGRLVGQKKPVGFYTTRYIDASSSDEAEMLVVENLRTDKGLSVPEKYCAQDAKIFFMKVEEAPPETERKPNAGFTFYTMGT